MIDDLSEERVIAATVAWLERMVIGLNLCPFAKAVHVKRLIRFVVSSARDGQALMEDLRRELCLLATTPEQQIETTLLIHPNVMQDFVIYNEFLWDCDLAIQEMNMEGVIQIASFHPDYRFSGTTQDDVTNHTNRSPFPMLHLLREASVTLAVETFARTEDIYENNIKTLQELGKVRTTEMLKRCMDERLNEGFLE